MQSIYWVIGYLEGRIDWFKEWHPEELAAIAELQSLLDEIR